MPGWKPPTARTGLRPSNKKPDIKKLTRWQALPASAVCYAIKADVVRGDPILPKAIAVARLLLAQAFCLEVVYGKRLS